MVSPPCVGCAPLHGQDRDTVNVKFLHRRPNDYADSPSSTTVAPGNLGFVKYLSENEREPLLPTAPVCDFFHYEGPENAYFPLQT